MLSSAPVLRTANFDLPFSIQVDACDVGMGAVLLQEDTHSGLMHPICFHSEKFNVSQRNYSTIEKECLSIILSLRKFNFFIYDSPHRVIIQCDHNPLKFISKMKNHNQRLMRWAMELQDYSVDVVHIRGKDNVIADCLSRMYM